MIGKKGVIIQEMIDKSGVMKVRVVGEEENKQQKQPDMVPFRFIGTSESIQNVFALLDYHISYLKVFFICDVIIADRVFCRISSF